MFIVALFTGGATTGIPKLPNLGATSGGDLGLVTSGTGLHIGKPFIAFDYKADACVQG